MTALQALINHAKRLQVLSDEEDALRDKIDRARDALDAANEAEQPIVDIKSKRRSLLAQVFLGGEKADPGALDAELKAAEKKVGEARQTKEAAEAALEVLNAKLSAVLFQINEEKKREDQLYYDALLERARSTLPRFLAILENFFDAYAEVMGAHHAVDAFADLNAGRPNQLSAYAPLAQYTKVAIPWLPGVEDEKRSRNVVNQAAAYRDDARESIERAVQKAMKEPGNGEHKHAA